MTNGDDEQNTSSATMHKELSKEDSNKDSSLSESAQANEAAVPDELAPATPWQAIFSPQYNAYYFYNTETQQTTWENPLLPTTESSSTTNPTESTTDSNNNGPSTQYAALQAAAIAAGIDPSLAHLDPNLLSSIPSSSANPSPLNPALLPTFTAKFNARTGQFTRPDGRDPTHLSEHARMTRMSEFYFDVKGWEEELAQRGGSLMGNEEEATEGGKKRKRPTKKDLVSVSFLFLMFSHCPLLIGTLQRAEKTEEDRQDGVVAHLMPVEYPITSALWWTTLDGAWRRKQHYFLSLFVSMKENVCMCRIFVFNLLYNWLYSSQAADGGVYRIPTLSIYCERRNTKLIPFITMHLRRRLLIDAVAWFEPSSMYVRPSGCEFWISAFEIYTCHQKLLSKINSTHCHAQPQNIFY